MMPRRGVLAGVVAALGACAPMRVAQGPVPAPGETRRDIAYGPGPRARLDLTLPEGTPRATLVFLYGGGFESGDRGTYRFVARAFAAEGLAVVIPDYRVWPEVRWPAFIADAAAATAWAQGAAGRAAGVPDAPLFLMGHSAGAFLALALATDARWLGAASRAALAGVIGLSGPYDFAPSNRPLPEIFATAPGGRASAAPADDAALRGTPRALLLHGEADRTVEPDQTRRLAARLTAADVPVQTRFYPGVGHVGIMAALAGPLRALGLSGAPVLEDVTAFTRPA